MSSAALPQRPENAAIRRYLEAGATPATSERSREDPRLAGWELRCHPDLVERLQDAATQTGVEPSLCFGLPVLVHPSGIAFAAAVGTSLVLLRLPEEARDDLQRSRWGSEGLDDPAWVDVEPWLDLPGPEPVQRLSEWVTRAFEHASVAED